MHLEGSDTFYLIVTKSIAENWVFVTERVDYIVISKTIRWMETSFVTYTEGIFQYFGQNIRHLHNDWHTFVF